tara:strand:- start:1172 stop:1552 length:381 start_codon:yes stop_codon:yes gene_type:complete
MKNAKRIVIGYETKGGNVKVGQSEALDEFMKKEKANITHLYSAKAGQIYTPYDNGLFDWNVGYKVPFSERYNPEFHKDPEVVGIQAELTPLVQAMIAEGSPIGEAIAYQEKLTERRAKTKSIKLPR